MADPKDSDNSKFAQYTIADNFAFLDCYKGNSIHSDRVGYVLLTSRNYLTGGSKYSTWTTPGASIKMPLPDSFYIPTTANWNDKEEEKWGEAVAKIMEYRQKNPEGGVLGADWTEWSKIATGTIARYAAKAFLGTAAGSALTRSLGLAYNPNKQMYYEGPTFETQQLQFTLMPRNRKEAVAMYRMCKVFSWAALPGTGVNLANEVSNIVQQIATAMAGDGFTGWLAEKFTPGLESVGKAFGETPFFTYPNLWDFEVRVPGPKADSNVQSDGHRTLFRWNNLAMTDVRISFDSNFKWHEDALPTKILLSMGLKETQLRTKENLNETMPVAIV